MGRRRRGSKLLSSGLWSIGQLSSPQPDHEQQQNKRNLTRTSTSKSSNVLCGGESHTVHTSTHNPYARQFPITMAPRSHIFSIVGLCILALYGAAYYGYIEQSFISKHQLELVSILSA